MTENQRYRGKTLDQILKMRADERKEKSKPLEEVPSEKWQGSLEVDTVHRSVPHRTTLIKR